MTQSDPRMVIAYLAFAILILIGFVLWVTHA